MAVRVIHVWAAFIANVCIRRGRAAAQLTKANGLFQHDSFVQSAVVARGTRDSGRNAQYERFTSSGETALGSRGFLASR